MNSEQRKFKKVIKSRKRHAAKKRILDLDTAQRRAAITKQNRAFRAERKRTAEKRFKERVNREIELRKILEMPTTDISLFKLEQLYAERYSKEQKKALQKAVLATK